ECARTAAMLQNPHRQATRGWRRTGRGKARRNRALWTIAVPQDGHALVAWLVERDLVDLPVGRQRVRIVWPGCPVLLNASHRHELHVHEADEVADRGPQ